MRLSAPRGPLQHRQIPAVENLEGRQLLSAAASSNMSYRVNVVRHEYHVFVGDLQRLELESRATPAEALALRDDAREISQAASTTTLSLPAAQAKALAVSLQLGRAPLNGSVGDLGWSVIAARLTSNLSGLNVPQSLIDQTVADMRAVARSAGVTAAESRHLDAAMQTLLDGEQWLGSNSYYTFPNPQLYYTQHLRGFFRGGPADKVSAQAKRDTDLRHIQVGAGDRPAGANVLHSDARLLEAIGATLTSRQDTQFGATFLAAFAQGPPSTPTLAQLPANLRAALGPGAAPATQASADQLATDAGAFFHAVGSSARNASLVVSDVQALVNAGGAQPLDPFKVHVIPVTPAGT